MLSLFQRRKHRPLHVGFCRTLGRDAEELFTQRNESLAPLPNRELAAAQRRQPRVERFNDGAEGKINLEGELEGEMFSPLRDLDQFKRFSVDPEIETIVWENGADLAPEFLYENMTVMA